MKLIITLLLLLTTISAKPQTVLDPPSAPLTTCDSLFKECKGFVDTLVSLTPMKLDYLNAREEVLKNKIASVLEDENANNTFGFWLRAGKEYVGCYYKGWNGCDKKMLKLRLATNETKFKAICFDE